MAAEVPQFEHTPLDAIPGIASGLRRTFLSHKTRDINFRLVQLRKLYWGLVDHEAAIYEACRRDLGRGTFETYMSELAWCQKDILFVCDNLQKWAQDESAPDIPFAFKLFGPKIRKDPLGTVLVIGAYNFPIMLSFGPLIGAISAGCTVLLKPSEGSPATAAVMEKIIKEYLDPEAYAVVQGAIPETTALLDQKWDKIFYTGSATVGTIIAKKAAETLTPVVLELGGRNPAIVTKNADVHLAARRLLWAKVMNAGQVCVSQNYILVDREVMPLLITELKKAFDEFFPNGAKASPDYSRIVNLKQFLRLKKMLDESRGRIVVGGTMDEKELFIEPTVVQVDDVNDSLIQEESFGPLVPVLAVNNLDEAIKIANEVHDTPLGIYPFGTKAETQRVLTETRSGGASVNDSFFHASIPTMPFGGVGTSGQGAYRGRSSFEVFSHRRSFTTTPLWMEKMLSVRYPPFSADKKKQYNRMNPINPNFDRNGKVKRGLFFWLFGLGASETSSAGIRWVIVILIAFLARKQLQSQFKL